MKYPLTAYSPSLCRRTDEIDASLLGPACFFPAFVGMQLYEVMETPVETVSLCVEHNLYRGQVVEYIYTTGLRYNTIGYNAIFHTPLQFPK